ncbi:MAG TPA: PIN domain nuclease [Planktothrix sp. UBA8407]|jgi:Uncharacterized protein conserved in bacteria|nr:PIN domain nuclease [Planktothrix sp. UBA8407]HBK24068.1 PIN domain nuclease [Planktothrix sp. UBA10369]
MKYLLDTHILIWFISGDKQLSLYAKELIENEDNELLVSIASLWEMAIKFNLGKLELGQPFEDLFPTQLEENNIDILKINLEHLNILCKLPLYHRDPFDRLIVCQALVEQFPVISKDTILDNYGIKREWEI